MELFRIVLGPPEARFPARIKPGRAMRLSVPQHRELAPGYAGLLEQRAREREAAFQELKARLKRGAVQAERGDLLDGEEVFEELAPGNRGARAGKEESQGVAVAGSNS